MSKGLGKLQRDILAHLDAPVVNGRTGRPTDWTKIYGTEVVLGEGVYDLRNVKRQVWREVYKPEPRTMRNNTLCDPYLPDPDCRFIVSFSQAVRSLVRRGVLEDLRSVPVYLHDSGERVVVWHEPERRFVRLRDGEGGSNL